MCRGGRKEGIIEENERIEGKKKKEGRKEGIRGLTRECTSR